MPDNTKHPLTAEIFAAEYPELSEKVTTNAAAEGKKEVRELFARFVEKFGDDPAFCIEQFSKGATIEEATEAQNVKLKEQNTELAEKAAQQTTKSIDSAAAEFNDEQTGEEASEKPKTAEDSGQQAGEKTDNKT